MEYLLGVCNSSNNSTINCWNYTTGNVEHVYSSKHKALNNSLCLLRKDYVLIAELNKPLLHLWSINGQESQLRLILPDKAEAICIDNTCTYLVVGIGVSVYIWMICSGELLNVLQKNYQPISCIKISNTQHIVIAGKDGILTTYNFDDAVSKIINRNSEPLYVKNDHADAITDLDIGLFGSHSRLVSVSLDQTCRMYDLESGEPLLVFAFNSPLTSIVLDATSWNVYIGDNNGKINVIEIKGDIKMQHIDDHENAFEGHSKKITSMDINLTHNLLATASEDCSIIIWDLKTRKQIRVFKQELPPSGLLFISGHSNIHSKTFTPKLQVQGLKKTQLDDLGTVFVVQNDDISIDEKDNNVMMGGLRSCSNNNVEELEIVNKQLYETLNMIIKKKFGTN
ncbi:WD repeat-containing protein 18 [Onthophagus taurus]|uniref:WD repeat-containing protein 18 n=1 Tax=Onthophagus taurus TaxID=166361 RepID=UPI0039BDC05D